MNKGQMLNTYLFEASIIHSKMRKLFTDNNINELDLKLLNESDLKKWRDYKKQAEEIGEKMCILISNF